MALLLAIMAAGIYIFWVLSVKTHKIIEIAYETPWGPVTTGVHWGIFVSTYVFFVVASTGICIISSIGHVFGQKDYKLISKRAVFLAMILLISGYIPLLAHLGRPERMLNFILTPNFDSSMWWMGFFYSFYLVFVATEFWLLLKGNMKWAKVTGFIAVISAVSTLTLGTVFSRVEANALWYGSYYPLYFILSAMISGAAIITLVSIVTYRARGMEMEPALREFLMGPFRRLFAFLILIGMMFVAWKGAMSVSNLGTYAAMSLLLQGPYSTSFWVIQILLGAIIPFLILVYPGTGRTFSGLSIASTLVLIGIYFVRYDWTIAGQAIQPIPLLEGLLYYRPSHIEIIIVLGASAFCAFLYSLGVRYLPLDVEEVN